MHRSPPTSSHSSFSAYSTEVKLPRSSHSGDAAIQACKDSAVLTVVLTVARRYRDNYCRAAFLFVLNAIAGISFPSFSPDVHSFPAVLDNIDVPLLSLPDASPFDASPLADPPLAAVLSIVLGLDPLPRVPRLVVLQLCANCAKEGWRKIPLTNSDRVDAAKRRRGRDRRGVTAFDSVSDASSAGRKLGGFLHRRGDVLRGVNGQCARKRPADRLRGVTTCVIAIPHFFRTLLGVSSVPRQISLRFLASLPLACRRTIGWRRRSNCRPFRSVFPLIQRLSTHPSSSTVESWKLFHDVSPSRCSYAPISSFPPSPPPSCDSSKSVPPGSPHQQTKTDSRRSAKPSSPRFCRFSPIPCPTWKSPWIWSRAAS